MPALQTSNRSEQSRWTSAWTSAHIARNLPQRARLGQSDVSSARNAPRDYKHYSKRAVLDFAPLAYGFSIAAVLIAAWTQRDEGLISADSGTGYWLGIVGASIMALLLLYPLRKRYRFLNWTGRVAGWFRLHMMLGILGPALVVLHTNFKLGSLNSRLALFTMLVVVASGVVGRYLYSKIHRGLYGAQSNISDILGDVEELEKALEAALGADPAFSQELAAFRPDPLKRMSVASGIASVVTLPFQIARARARLMRRAQRNIYIAPRFAHLTRSEKRALAGTISGHIAIFFAAVRKAGRFAFFERLFGLWHHLHVPLFVLLVLTVAIHVIAVHRY